MTNNLLRVNANCLANTFYDNVSMTWKLCSYERSFSEDVIYTQQAYDIEVTSYLLQCDVWRHIDVRMTLSLSHMPLGIVLLIALLLAPSLMEVKI